MKEVDFLVEKLNLIPHPEGGYFFETYRSETIVSLEQPYAGDRNSSTCIYFLLTSGNPSKFHKIHQDEIWHFYQGSTIHLHIISKDGQYELVKIGTNWEQDETPQYVVKGGNWFASEIIQEDQYALAGCTVSPGFDFKDFEMAERNALLRICPSEEKIISRLTPKT